MCGLLILLALGGFACLWVICLGASEVDHQHRVNGEDGP